MARHQSSSSKRLWPPLQPAGMSDFLIPVSDQVVTRYEAFNTEIRAAIEQFQDRHYRYTQLSVQSLRAGDMQPGGHEADQAEIQIIEQALGYWLHLHAPTITPAAEVFEQVGYVLLRQTWPVPASGDHQLQLFLQVVRAAAYPAGEDLFLPACKIATTIIVNARPLKSVA